MSQVVKIFVSRAEAVEMLGLSVRTIDRLCLCAHVRVLCASAARSKQRVR
jgi:hypothetical protein